MEGLTVVRTEAEAPHDPQDGTHTLHDVAGAMRIPGSTATGGASGAAPAEGRAMSEHAPLILLVEDEAMLRMAATDLLEEMGFRVDTAGSAREATARVDHAGAAYDAVIIDLGLPDRSGADLAREIRGNRADVPIVIASGYDETDLEDVLADDTRIGFLGKPYGARSMTRVFVALGIAIDHPLAD